MRARTTDRKRRGREQFVDQPEDMSEEVASISRGGPARTMLDARAKELGIEGRIDLDDAALLHATDEVTAENGRGRGDGLRNMKKAELLTRAKAQGIKERWRMSKQDLVRALSGSGAFRWYQ